MVKLILKFELCGLGFVIFVRLSIISQILFSVLRQHVCIYSLFIGKLNERITDADY
jgi:hypothetical protein